jgi:superfamily I DNA/RNA helicase
LRTLSRVSPTPEQLTIVSDNRAGFYLVRGAAGSGKTTTALLRLRQLCESWLSRRTRLALADPVRVLVLTYNRTLEGYIRELARDQVPEKKGLDLEVRTFGKWALSLIPPVNILDRDDAARILRPLLAGFPGDREFLVEELEYLLGRFEPSSLTSYLTTRRDGRGLAPRIDQTVRQRLLDEVVHPYGVAKQERSLSDWNDIAVMAKAVPSSHPWDVVIVDEAQDFSANQVRAILHHRANPFSMTFVMDAVQRIYPRFFTWREAGVGPFASVHTLRNNYRNTKQIAALARPIVDGLPLEDDGAIPNFESCTFEGALPKLLVGKYSQQIDFVLDKLLPDFDLTNESVVFLQPRGGNWFSYLRNQLRRRSLPWVELTRASTWPSGPEAIGLCTFHSVKGLEFDHVVMPGLNDEVTPHGAEEGHAQLHALRRLVAMGVGRARKTVTIGYKTDDPSVVVGLLKPDTYELVGL